MDYEYTGTITNNLKKSNSIVVFNSMSGKFNSMSDKFNNMSDKYRVEDKAAGKDARIYHRRIPADSTNPTSAFDSN
jgi:hypothetical protein